MSKTSATDQSQGAGSCHCPAELQRKVCPNLCWFWAVAANILLLLGTSLLSWNLFLLLHIPFFPVSASKFSVVTGTPWWHLSSSLTTQENFTSWEKLIVIDCWDQEVSQVSGLGAHLDLPGDVSTSVATNVFMLKVTSPRPSGLGHCLWSWHQASLCSPGVFTFLFWSL